MKTGFVGKIPSLFDLCLRVIQDNIDDLGYTGGVPYEILEPALIKTSANQLMQVEHYNPYLVGMFTNESFFHYFHFVYLQFSTADFCVFSVQKVLTSYGSSTAPVTFVGFNPKNWNHGVNFIS